ncbi:hypothetical protein [Siphonobacter curvatus]|uniref:hypothetical protein n=1 Tax=Siphonobacter curvatus TaxID=2094562 RepID=UPI00293730C1|nr:hypothetical protein [Siphonobacter curvatus]
MHSIFRWLVLLSLIYALVRAIQGYRSGRVFTKTDDSVRHWTATIAHVQLLIGIILYTQSPLVSYYFGTSRKEALAEPFFFSIIHIALMLLAVVGITLGSSMAKRKPTANGKFLTQIVWFSLALLLIFVAIPWPFSPLATRPYFRPY